MRALLFLVVICFGARAQAQRANSDVWFNADYTYNALNYAELNRNEQGHFAGVRGELGLVVLPWMGISAGGEYMDGNLVNSGTLLSGAASTATSRDYIADLRAMAHIFAGPFVLAGGVAQREWYDSNGSFRERQFYSYYPASITWYQQFFYMRAEADFWSKGHAHAYMSDLGGGQNDIDVSLKSGSAYMGEIGLLIPTALHLYTRIFVAYKHWEVAASNLQSDAASTLQVPKSSTSTVSGGIGISF